MIQAENAENIDSFSWTVHEQNGSAIVQTKGPFKTATGMYSLRMSTVGTSKITVLGGGQSDFIVVSAIGLQNDFCYKYISAYACWSLARCSLASFMYIFLNFSTFRTFERST